MIQKLTKTSNLSHIIHKINEIIDEINSTPLLTTLESVESLPEKGMDSIMEGMEEKVSKPQTVKKTGRPKKT